jgi:hypothetical protein
MRRTCAKIFPKNLNDDQKKRRNEASAEMLERLETQPDFPTRVKTGDESWFFEYNPETNRQNKKWHTSQSPGRKKARMSKYKINIMVIILLFSWGSS